MMKKSVYKILLPGGSFAAITAEIIGLIIYIQNFIGICCNQDENNKKEPLDKKTNSKTKAGNLGK
jgi:hypothetical protein